jgi:RNA polymerase sigma-70 factor (ECF subfamily)
VEEEFDRLYAAHCDGVYRFLLRLTRQPELAKDLHQETWIKLARNFRVLAPSTEIRGWLFTVARNLWRDHARGRAREAARVDALEMPAPADSDDAADARRRVARLETALGELPEGSREVLLLVAIEGMEPSQAAAVLGLTPEATRQRLSRARTQLAAALDEGSAKMEGA